MLNLRKTNLLVLLIIMMSVIGCRDLAVPKPKGYFRIDLPPKNYISFNIHLTENNTLPLSFDYPSYGTISLNVENQSEPGWFNIEFPAYNAKIYLTYKDVNDDLPDLIEQTYELNVKNHIMKADAINEHIIKNQADKIYGILYDLKGNTATSIQFYVTDSTNHYLRGSLYFSAEPNADSLAPLIDFFREDIVHLIETLKWKE